MKKKSVFLVMAVFTAALFLAGCQEPILPDPEEFDTSGLFLRFSSKGELDNYYIYPEDKISRYYYPYNKSYVPNSLLFEVNYGSVLPLNSHLVVKNYTVSSGGNKANFILDSTLPIIISAFKLPFKQSDAGVQSDAGNDRFNGLLKVNFYIFAIKGGEILIYDVESEKTFRDKGVFNGDSFSFKIESKNCTLNFDHNSPVGNFFEFEIDEEKKECFTLLD
jgi:hypothetical protein